MDFATLYEQDTETWAELQVAALRRLASMPGFTNAVDWQNVIEEIEDLGSEKRESVESLLENVLIHLLKIIADPRALSADHWRREVNVFLAQARSKARRSMRSRIDMDEVWRRAAAGASNALDAYDRVLPPGLPDQSPFSFDELWKEGVDQDRLLDLLKSRAFK